MFLMIASAIDWERQYGADKRNEQCSCVRSYNAYFEAKRYKHFNNIELKSDAPYETLFVQYDDNRKNYTNMWLGEVFCIHECRGKYYFNYYLYCNNDIELDDQKIEIVNRWKQPKAEHMRDRNNDYGWWYDVDIYNELVQASNVENSNEESQALTQTSLSKLDSNEEELLSFLKALKPNHRQIILQGPPGTSKTHTAEWLAHALTGEGPGSQGANSRVEIVQFHPAYNYEDFVRGIQVATDTEGRISYQTTDRIFAQMCKRASNDQANKYVLIIDEINRAHLAAVLGELIYALEKRGQSIRTPYADPGANGHGSIMVPENLYVIGTMNTADRTIGHIDYAVRRRFAFHALLPNREVIEKYDRKETQSAALALFNAVEQLFKPENGALSPEFHADDVQIGHTYFLAKNKNELFMAFTYQVYPLLREYVKDGILALVNDKLALYIEGKELTIFPEKQPDEIRGILDEVFASPGPATSQGEESSEVQASSDTFS